jgi:hypothetical protein
VVGREVAGRKPITIQAANCIRQRLAAICKSIIGGHDQHWPIAEANRGVRQPPRAGVNPRLVGECLRRRPCQDVQTGAHSDVFIDTHRRWTSVAEGQPEVDTRDQRNAEDIRSLCHEASGYAPSHTMSDNDNPMRVELQGRICTGTRDPVKRSPGILEAVLEAKNARASPGSTIVDGQDVPSHTPNRLRKVRILLVSRQAMQEEHGGTGARSRSRIEDRIEVHAAARDRQGQRLCRRSGISRKITTQCRDDVLVKLGQEGSPMMLLMWASLRQSRKLLACPCDGLPGKVRKVTARARQCSNALLKNAALDADRQRLHTTQHRESHAGMGAGCFGG